MIKDLFVQYAWLGQLALVVAFATFAGLLVHLVLERRSPRWARDARLPLDEAREARS